MAGVYVNNQKSIYATDTRVNSITTDVTQIQNEVNALQSNVTILAGEIAQIEVNLGGSMIQYYKATDTFSQSNLLPGDVYSVVDGYTGISLDLPTTGNFVVASPGVIQYNGASTFFFQINYQITSTIDSGTFNCAFVLRRNIDLLDSSKQTVSMDSAGVHNLTSANGSALTPLSPGDTISLMAKLTDSVDTNALDVHNLSLTIFKIPSI